jgi:hypothetical protein
VKLYEVYDEACIVCGSHDTRDHGPYEPHPLDACLVQPLDDRIHLMSCRACGKSFDVAPSAVVEAQMNLLRALGIPVDGGAA